MTTPGTVPLLTAAYGLWLTLRLGLGAPHEEMTLAPVPATMRWSTQLLALASLGLGVVPGPLYTVATRAAALLMGGAP